MSQFVTIAEFENPSDAEFFSNFLLEEVGVETGVVQYSLGGVVWVVGAASQLSECRRLFEESFRDGERCTERHPDCNGNHSSHS